MESAIQQFQFSSLCCDQAVRSVYQTEQEKHRGGVQFILWCLTQLQKPELSKTNLPDFYQEFQVCQHLAASSWYLRRKYGDWKASHDQQWALAWLTGSSLAKVWLWQLNEVAENIMARFCGMDESLCPALPHVGCSLQSEQLCHQSTPKVFLP